MNMRKRPNRFLAMVLSLCMLFTMLPLGAITARAVDAPQVNSGISNITGYNGSYDSIYWHYGLLVRCN